MAAASACRPAASQEVLGCREDKYNFASVQTWHAAKKLGPYLLKTAASLFDFDLLMVPICVNLHWVMLVADLKKGVVHTLDSAQVSMIAVALAILGWQQSPCYILSKTREQVGRCCNCHCCT